MDLGETARLEGFRLLHMERAGSTNDEASAAARAGDPGRLWIVANEQVEGRGRRGRAWVSPCGNLYASVLLVAPCDPRRAPELGFVAGVALHDAVSRTAGLDLEALRLKWPNDLLYRGAKLAGILVEGTSVPDGNGQLVTAAVIGIGVNVLHHPPDTPYPATDLARLGTACTAAALFTALSDAMTVWLGTWAAGDGFAAVRGAWLERAGGLGQPIVVRRADGERHGIFRDLDAEGRLLLDEQGKMTAIEAGDVFLAGQARPTA